MEFGYKPTGDETQEDLTVDDAVGERIVDFFQRTRALSPGTRPFFGCYSFVWYALGRADLKKYDGYHFEYACPVDSTPMGAGEAYGVASTGGRSLLNHAMLAMNRPDHNLSILNTGLPLAVVSNADTVASYNGKAIKHIVPKFAYFIDNEA
jgi:hypothetical protein